MAQLDCVPENVGKPLESMVVKRNELKLNLAQERENSLAQEGVVAASMRADLFRLRREVERVLTRAFEEIVAD